MIARIVVAAVLVIGLALSAVYVAAGDWDRGRVIGAQSVNERGDFEAALNRRFAELTPAEHTAVCEDVIANGLEVSVDVLRERHYTQPGGPRMPFFYDSAVAILNRECGGIFV